MQKKLAEIWQNLLGIEGVGVDENFFDLGGTSLLSVRLFAEIERAFGVGLPLSTLFRASTIEALCALLESEHALEEALSLRLLSPAGGSTALHLIHDVDGETDVFRPLAECLGSAVRVYALAPHGGPSFPVLHTRITEMADHYARKIREVQPEGPYHVGGLGAGGVLAHAVACRLQAGGERVALVALLDCADPFSRKTASGVFEKMDLGLAQRLRARTAQLSKTLTRSGMEYARVKLLRRYVDRGEKPPWFLEHISFETVYRFAVTEYTPDRFEGKLTFFRAAGLEVTHPQDPATRDGHVTWSSRATNGVALVDVAGGHRTMLEEPHVASLARVLGSAITPNAQAKTA